jgi:hypothetical protein
MAAGEPLRDGHIAWVAIPAIGMAVVATADRYEVLTDGNWGWALDRWLLRTSGAKQHDNSDHADSTFHQRSLLRGWRIGCDAAS